jgi:hypothetical protein
MNYQAAAVLLSLTLLFFGIVYADEISSSIASTGAAFVSSSVTGAGTEFSQSLFTVDPAIILRDLFIGETIRTKSLIRSEGPTGIDEYTSKRENQSADPRICLFILPENQSSSGFENRVLGLLQEGTYISSNTLGNDSFSLVESNGTGILLTRSVSQRNGTTTTHASDVLGGFNLSESVGTGGDNVA